MQLRIQLGLCITKQIATYINQLEAVQRRATILDAMQLFIPVCKIHPNLHPLWFNSDIRHNIKRLRTLHRRYKTTHHISCIINSLELTLQNKIKAAKQSFEYNLINSYATTNNNKILIQVPKIH